MNRRPAIEAIINRMDEMEIPHNWVTLSQVKQAVRDVLEHMCDEHGEVTALKPLN